MSYEIGQVFENEVPNEVHNWCASTYVTQQPCYPKEIEPLADGTRRWQIATDDNSDNGEWTFRRISELQSYLSATDWYAIRKSETRAEMPQEVVERRQAARDEISQLREELAGNGGTGNGS